MVHWVSPLRRMQYDILVRRWADRYLEIGDAADSGPEWRQLREFDRKYPEIRAYVERQLKLHETDRPPFKCTGGGFLAEVIKNVPDQRPYRRVFTWRGFGMRMAAVASVCLAVFVVQVAWMLWTNVGDQEAAWLAMVMAGNASGQRQTPNAKALIALFFIAIFSLLFVIPLSDPLGWRRIPPLAFLNVTLAMFLGVVMGRALLYERLATGAAACHQPNPDCFVQADGTYVFDAETAVGGGSNILTTGDGVAAMLPPALFSIAFLAIGLVVGVLAARVPKRFLTTTGPRAWLACAVGLLGLVFMSGNGQLLLKSLFGVLMGLLWVPGEMSAVRFCVRERLDARYQLEAALDIALASQLSLFMMLPWQ